MVQPVAWSPACQYVHCATPPPPTTETAMVSIIGGHRYYTVRRVTVTSLSLQRPKIGIGYIATVNEAHKYCIGYIVAITEAEKIVSVTS
jgi:hypothetical protein